MSYGYSMTMDEIVETQVSSFLSMMKQSGAIADYKEILESFASDPVGFALQFMGMNLLSDDIKKVFRSVLENPTTNVPAAHGVGKCRMMSSKLHLACGKIISFSEALTMNDFLVNTLNEEGQVVKAIARAFPNGKKRCYRITTETGKVLEGTDTHPIWSAIKYSADGCHPMIQFVGWNSLKTLAFWEQDPPDIQYHAYNAYKTGGRKDGKNRERKARLLCAIPKEVPVFGNNQIPEEWLTIIAFIIGDGGISYEGVGWSQLPNEQCDEMRRCVESVGCNFHLVGKSDRHYAIYGKRIEGVEPRKYEENYVLHKLQEYELMGKGSAEKFIPNEILECTKPLLAYFLNRLFSTDGWACLRNNKTRTTQGVEVGYSSNSERLIRQVQSLLLRFGIHCNLEYREKVNNWQLFIHRTHDVLSFAEQIGMMGHKGDALAECVKVGQEKFDTKQMPRWRTQSAHSGTLWEEIVSIEYIGRHETVGIEVDEYHTYLTDFFEHNSHGSAILVLWWVFCVKGQCITTAPTLRQVSDVLWHEVRRHYAKHSEKLGGEGGMLYLRLTEDAQAYGMTAQAHKADAFQGRHAERLLIIMDEANGIAEAIDDAADSCVVGGEYNKMLRIGNPTSTGTPFQNACNISCIRIPAWSHPNVRDLYGPDHKLKSEIAAEILDEKGFVKPQKFWPEWIPRDVIPGAISAQWIESTRKKKGESSAYWISRVEARFPTDSINSIIPNSWYFKARSRYDADPDYWDSVADSTPRSRIGQDVGDGTDKHTLARWRGPVLYFGEEMDTTGDGEDTERAINMSWRVLMENPGFVRVDSNGVGTGVHSGLKKRLRESQDVEWIVVGDPTDPKDPFGGKVPVLHTTQGPIHLTIERCEWGRRANDSATFADQRAEMLWTMREAFRVGAIAVAPLQEEFEANLLTDFQVTEWSQDEKSRIRIKSKDLIRAETGGRSTDAIDAVTMGFWPSDIKLALPSSFGVATLH